jgi:hypothetical protein
MLVLTCIQYTAYGYGLLCFGELQTCRGLLQQCFWYVPSHASRAGLCLYGLHSRLGIERPPRGLYRVWPDV